MLPVRPLESYGVTGEEIDEEWGLYMLPGSLLYGGLGCSGLFKNAVCELGYDETGATVCHPCPGLPCCIGGLLGPVGISSG